MLTVSLKPPSNFWNYLNICFSLYEAQSHHWQLDRAASKPPFDISIVV